MACPRALRRATADESLAPIGPFCGEQEEPWKSLRFSDNLEAACRTFTKDHVDLATSLWKDKSADEYKDPALALQMKRALCTAPDIGACSHEELPDAYKMISAKKECTLCQVSGAPLGPRDAHRPWPSTVLARGRAAGRPPSPSCLSVTHGRRSHKRALHPLAAQAMVGDMHRTVRASRDAGAKVKSDPYFRLVGLMAPVCDELPMRHSIRREVQKIVLCPD